MNKRSPDAHGTSNDGSTATQPEIRQDAEGRYCLNDLHAIAGGSPDHHPSRYFELTQTQELIMSLGEKRGTTGAAPAVELDGLTLVLDDLAIDYVAWMSPEFRKAILGGFRAHRDRFIAGEADIRPMDDVLEETLQEAKERNERAGNTRPH